MMPSEMQISRVSRSKQEAKATYDKMSHWYDLMAGSAEKKAKEAGLHKLDAKDGERILEIGFGTGHCLLALAQSTGDRGQVYGIDLSEGMVDVTQARIKKADLARNVRLVCGDAMYLPFKAGCFDAIFASFVLDLFDTPDIPVVLDACRTSLRDGGRICVVAMSKRGKNGVMIRLYEWAHTRFPRYVDCRPIYAHEALQEAGFQVVDATEMSLFGLPVEIVVAKANHGELRPP